MNFYFKIFSYCLLLLSCVKENQSTALLGGTEPKKITLTKGQSLPFMNDNRWELDGAGFVITEKLRQEISGCKIRIQYEPQSMKLTYEMDVKPNFRVRRNFDLSSDTEIMQAGGEILIKHKPKTREGERKTVFSIGLVQTTDSQRRPRLLNAQEQEISNSPEKLGLLSLETECNTIDSLKKPDAVGGSLRGLDIMKPQVESPKPILTIQGDKSKEIRFNRLNRSSIVVSVHTAQLENGVSKWVKTENFTIPHNINVRPMFSYQLDWSKETRSQQFKLLQFEFPYSAHNNFQPKSGINSCNAREISIAMELLATTMVDALIHADFYSSEWGAIARQILIMAWELKAYNNLNYPQGGSKLFKMTTVDGLY